MSILRERGSQMPQGRESAWDSHSARHVPNLDHAKRLLAACSCGVKYCCIDDSQSLLMHWLTVQRQGSKHCRDQKIAHRDQIHDPAHATMSSENEGDYEDDLV